MARVPAEPRVARMLLAASEEGSLQEVLVLAAALSIQDPRERPTSAMDSADRAQVVFRHEQSDFLTLLRIWDQFHHAADEGTGGELRDWCRRHFLSHVRMRDWMDTYRQLRDLAEEMDLRFNDVPAREEAIHRALLTGLISNVCAREEVQGSFDYRGIKGNVVSLFPGSVLFKHGPKWIMAAEIVQTTRLYARTAAKIDPAWIEELAGHMFTRQLADKHLDRETGEASAWERVTMSGIVVVPRRSTPLAPIDPAAARAIFIREGLAKGLYPPTSVPPPAFAIHNRSILAQARAAEAKLRRRNLIVDDDALAAWFERRVPASVVDPLSFEAWRAHAESKNPRTLFLDLADVLKPDAAAAADPHAYPDSIAITTPEGPIEAPLAYALEPGKDQDGLTLSLPLLALPSLTNERAAWLVPGMLEEKCLAILKSLPKAHRSAIEAKGALVELASELAGVLDFGVGLLPAALSEGVRVMRGIDVPSEAWPLAGVPPHLQLRVRVLDESGEALGASRDLDALRERLAPRLERALAAAARSRYEREGLTAWTIGDLPERVATDRAGRSVEAYPALVDRGTSVALTLLDSPDEASIATTRGVRRLFALACREEIAHRLAALDLWSDLQKWYKHLGETDELRDALTCLAAERAFLAGQSPIRTHSAFEQRTQEQWGRLAQSTIEVAGVVARLLEPRAKVAHRLSGGTPRLWAASIADIREQAAYLMPRGFLLLVPWERLREYPRYAEAMRARLFTLREDGSGVETEALRRLAPHWKRFTGWVANAMSEERERWVREAGEDENGAARTAGGTLSADGKKGKARVAPSKAPLPQARRAAPVVNLDAGAWALQPGQLPPAVAAYRWALEEFRVAIFAPEGEGARKGAVTEKSLDELWRDVK